ncbi:MAG TPA: methyltransferase domain-containing protein [Reyranella sp.]|nr:methyltransferase domain-containing protein [Reyranella sp.]
MTAAGDAPPLPRKGELHIVGTTVGREIERLLDRVAEAAGRRIPRILQVGSRGSVSDRNELNWRSLIARRFEGRARFVGIDLLTGPDVDQQLDICASPRAISSALGREAFDLIVCCHVLEHTPAPMRAARNIESLLRPGGLAYISTPWSQAFHAAPDDYWRFSRRGLALLFQRLEILSSFYSGGDVGLDVAYRVERDGRLSLEAEAGAVERGLFQLVLDHEDNRALLARQATERLPVSRTYLPTLFVNLVGRRTPK